MGARGACWRLTLRKCAYSVLREAAGADAECGVESSAVVLPGDQVAELEYTLVTEATAQGGDEGVVDFGRGATHPRGEVDDHEFVLVEETGLERVREGEEVLV